MEITETPKKARIKREILTYIQNYRKWANGRSPTYAEIGRKFGIDQASAKGYYVNELIRDGWLTYTPRTARSLVPARPASEYPIPGEGEDVSA